MTRFKSPSQLLRSADARAKRRKQESREVRRRSLRHAFENLEKRLLLSADHPWEDFEQSLTVQEFQAFQAQQQLLEPFAFDSIDPNLRLIDTDLSKIRGQIVYLDFDGAKHVTYDGPITVTEVSVPAFDASQVGLLGQESEIISSVVDLLNDRFESLEVTFTSQLPNDDRYSTIYIGGDDSAFSEHGSFLGLAESVDVGNVIPNDEAFVFSESLARNRHSKHAFVARIEHLVAHEAGHLLGFEHHDAEEESLSGQGAADPLAHIAFAQGEENAVHQWISLQGARLFASQFGTSEFDHYIGPPDYDGPLIRAYDDLADNNFIEGAYDEDVWTVLSSNTANPFGDKIPVSEHFWSHNEFVRAWGDASGLTTSDDAAPNRAYKYFSGGKDIFANTDDPAWSNNGIRSVGIESMYQEEDFEAGSVSYDHQELAGGNFGLETIDVRRLTIVGSDRWPTWASQGTVTIKGKSYPVASRESDTVLILDQEANPGGDIELTTDWRLQAKPTAYYWLGHAAHLLQDLSLPSHALADPHLELVNFGFDPDPLHDWVDGQPFGSLLVSGNPSRQSDFEDETPNRWEAWGLNGTRVAVDAEVRSPIQIVSELGSRLSQSIEIASSSIDFVQDVVTTNSHGLVTGEAVRFSSSGTGELPDNVDVNHVYFVRVLDGDKFSLHTTHRGAAVGTAGFDRLDFGSSGSGTHTLYRNAELWASIPNADNLDSEDQATQFAAIFLESASLADNYDTKDYLGQYDQGNRRGSTGLAGVGFDEFSRDELNEMADVLVPQAIRSTAELIRYFYSQVDFVPPSLAFADDSSGTLESPNLRSNSGVTLRLNASDSHSGNTGIGNFNGSHSPPSNRG